MYIYVGPGLYFGERALLTGEPRAANITALTNVVLMALDRESFTSLLGPLKEVSTYAYVLHIIVFINVLLMALDWKLLTSLLGPLKEVSTYAYVLCISIVNHLYHSLCTYAFLAYLCLRMKIEFGRSLNCNFYK
jgi:CRP-like cAMP-binding protein